MRLRIRHWFARLLCAKGWHIFERRGTWSRCVRVHRFPNEAAVYLCWVEDIRSAYDAGKGRMWLRDGDQ